MKPARILTIFYLAFATLCLTQIVSQKAPLQPLYAVDLSPLVPEGPQIYLTGALTFLTNHTLAVSMCSHQGCNLETLDFADNKPRVLARTREFKNYRALFRAPEGRVVLDHAFTENNDGAVVFDQDLHNSRLMPKAWIHESDISITGETFVQRLQGNDWAAYRMSSPPVQLRSGTGQVLSVSDDEVAYIDQSIVRIESMDGRHLGSFPMRDPSTVLHAVFLGHDRLWFDIGGQPEIRDFNGKTLMKFDRPDGWGFRLGRSSDGSRLLYDKYTRHVSLAQSVKEDAIAVATMGMGVVNQSANGEMVRVIDANTGKQCFEWYSKAGILLAGGYHADVDPSGKLVAIMTRASLVIYALPDVCEVR